MNFNEFPPINFNIRNDLFTPYPGKSFSKKTNEIYSSSPLESQDDLELLYSIVPSKEDILKDGDDVNKYDEYECLENPDTPKPETKRKRIQFTNSFGENVDGEILGKNLYDGTCVYTKNEKIVKREFWMRNYKCFERYEN